MLFADATALIALGEFGWIRLLRHFDPETIISAAVRSEVIRSAPQISDAIDNGWLSVRAVKPEHLAALRALVPALDRGEAETIVVLQNARPRRAKVLVDERAAFGVLSRLIDQSGDDDRLELVCLAQVLPGLEDRGVLPLTAKDAMSNLLINGHYAWAKNVRSHYLDWCERQDKDPLSG